MWRAIIGASSARPAIPLPGLEFLIRTIGIPRPGRPALPPGTRQDSARGAERKSKPLNETELRERTVSSMVSAALLAVVGTLIFAWALRTPEYPWLFAVGALPWGIGLCMFGRALWKYTRG